MRYLFIALLLLFFSCSGDNALHAVYNSLEKGSVNLGSQIESHELIVLLFLSPECPLCQNYAPTIREIQNSFAGKNISFYGVISGTFYPRKEILKYKLKYELNLPILLDPEIKLANQLNAKMTPEAVLLTKDADVIYMGAIDNWAISLGQKRIQATAHYLTDAINNHLAGRKINPTKTEPVGCFIE